MNNLQVTPELLLGGAIALVSGIVSGWVLHAARRERQRLGKAPMGLMLLLVAVVLTAYVTQATVVWPMVGPRVSLVAVCVFGGGAALGWMLDERVARRRRD